MAKRLWRRSYGRRGINRVTVYERRGQDSLYIEWWDEDGRHQHALSTVTGHPVTDKDLAMKIGSALSAEQEARRNALAAMAVGLPVPRTLKELLDALHETRSARWRESYRRDQERFRVFWTEKLGPSTHITNVTPRLVERCVRNPDWSPRTQASYLRYIVDAFTFARKKLKWIEERDDLGGVDFPRARPRSSEYTNDEAIRLLDALRQTDVRAWGVGEVAFCTGRRLNAIRMRRETDLELGEVALLRFDPGTDKANREGVAVLTNQAAEALAMQSPKRGWLFPNDSGTGPVRRELLITRLKQAEEVAGIEHVKGRAYHGLKRTFATIAEDRRAASKQSGTSEGTLRGRYEKDWLAPKIELAKQVEALRQVCHSVSSTTDENHVR